MQFEKVVQLDEIHGLLQNHNNACDSIGAKLPCRAVILEFPLLQKKNKKITKENNFPAFRRDLLLMNLHSNERLESFFCISLFSCD